MKISTISVSVLVLVVFTQPKIASAEGVDPFIQDVVQQLKQDLVTMMDYGSHQSVITTRLNESGAAKRIEEKTFQTVWFQNKPKNELIDVTCLEIDSKTGKSRRCNDVQPVKYQKTNKPGKIESEIKKIRWTEMHRNFDFARLPSEGNYDVISFRPKKEGISPTNRIEKLLNRMTGKVWVDKEFNVVKAEARLANPVSFGLGIAAKVNQLSIQYEQKPHKDIWLPSNLRVDFNAKVALVHTERQRIQVTWNNPYGKSENAWAHVNTISTAGKSNR